MSDVKITACQPCVGNPKYFDRFLKAILRTRSGALVIINNDQNNDENLKIRMGGR